MLASKATCTDHWLALYSIERGDMLSRKYIVRAGLATRMAAQMWEAYDWLGTTVATGTGETEVVLTDGEDDPTIVRRQRPLEMTRVYYVYHSPQEGHHRKGRWVTRWEIKGEGPRLRRVLFNSYFPDFRETVLEQDEVDLPLCLAVPHSLLRFKEASFRVICGKTESPLVSTISDFYRFFLVWPGTHLRILDHQFEFKHSGLKRLCRLTSLEELS